MHVIINEIPLGRLVKTDERIATIKFIVENNAIHGTTLEGSGGIVGKGLAKYIYLNSKNINRGSGRKGK